MASKNPKEIKEQLEELIKTHQSYADNEGYLFVVSPWGIIKDWQFIIATKDLVAEGVDVAIPGENETEEK